MLGELDYAVHASRGHLAVHVRLYDKLKATLVLESETWERLGVFKATGNTF